MFKVIRREEALRRGLRRYYTGKPCKYGHLAERLTKAGTCYVCNSIAPHVWAKKNREKCTERNRIARHANPEHARYLSRKAYWSHPERNRKAAGRWKVRNRVVATAAENARRAAKLCRTPPWADLKQIEKLYQDAKVMTKLLGEPFHVDHIIPLQGKFVSGLHVQNNLQILPGRENCKKSNKFDPQEAAQFT